MSTLPTLFGEKIVLRILDKGNLTLDLEKFGIEPKAEKDLMEAVSNPYGMVLVTGPTGSGKTTTLYSALSKVNNIDVNIMTAEDPVEYNLYGVNQVLVRTEIGMTFAAALKAFLRQDPNIIMVGEIRDLETGGIAIKAALTGHMVLSTLHTNSAPETVTRLLDMGLEPFNVASALNLVLAQRLLRRICGNCKAQYTPTRRRVRRREGEARPRRCASSGSRPRRIENAKARATKEAAPLLANVTLDTPVGDLPFFKGKGCDACGGTGMKGRQGVYEVMPMTPEPAQADPAERRRRRDPRRRRGRGNADAAHGRLDQGDEGHHDARAGGPGDLAYLMSSCRPERLGRHTETTIRSHGRSTYRACPMPATGAPEAPKPSAATEPPPGSPHH